MTTPAEREFQVLRRGFVRDKVILAAFRFGLRKLINPETGQLFTEDEIQRATQPDSRWYSEAEGIDQYGQLAQRRAIFVFDQTQIDRATTAYLEGPHATLWTPEGKLEETAGSGEVSVPAVSGTVILGSTTIPDEAAYWARDAAGNKYQVFTTETTPSSGTAQVTMVGIDKGAKTNLSAGDKLTWITRDPNMQAVATVFSDFTGGTDRETDAELAKRQLSNVRHQQGAGNDAQMRAWSRRATNSIEEAFVFPCAMYAGSVVVAITQKRAGVAGPLARIPNSVTLDILRSYITPPLSPTVPSRVFVVGAPVVAEYSNFVVRLDVPRGAAPGWASARPFPSYHATTPAITAVAIGGNPLIFHVLCSGDATLPGLAALATATAPNAPRLMVWDKSRTEWIPLSVASVQDLGANVYKVTLSSAPVNSAGAPFTLALGQLVSPELLFRTIAQEAIVEYFDELGPGDLFNGATDPRGQRCVRFPRSGEEWPYRATAELATRIANALGFSAANASLASMSPTTPSYPTNIVLGPNILVPGDAAVYPL